MTDRVVIRVRPDGLQATASVKTGPISGRADLDAALAEGGVVFGIDADSVQQLEAALADADGSLDEIALATGTAPVPGRDHLLDLCVVPRLRAGTSDERGRMDYRDRGSISRVRCGQVLARVTPADPGTPGRRVDGEVIEPRSAKATRITIGEGARYDEGRGEIVAARDGAVVYRSDPFFDVSEHFEHKGDVDLRSGDLDMAGTIMVSGDVKHGFIVRASGHVEIKGQVEAGIVVSEHDVQIHGGVSGGSTGRVVAGGSIGVRHAQAAVLHAGGRIEVRGDVVGGQLMAHQVCVEGSVRSADVRSEIGMQIGNAGDATGSRTVLAAAVPLPVDPLEVARATIEGARIRRRTRARVGNRLRTDRSGPPPGKETRVEVQLKRAENEALVSQRRREQELTKDAVIEIRGTAHPGVVIKIGTLCSVLDRPRHGFRIVADLAKRRLCQEQLT